MPRPKREAPGYKLPKDRPYIGINKAMSILGYSKSGVLKIIKAGWLPSAYQVDEDGAWIMLESDVIQFKKERNRNAE